MTLHILYLAHDLSDPAIRRRVIMLKAGGARLTVAGFLRDENRLADDGEIDLRVLGRTADGRLGQRMAAVARARLSLGRLLDGVQPPDVIIARNLETLALAPAAGRLFGGHVPLVYECLDIHRLLLDRGLKGRLLRAAEGRFGRAASLLVTSSPAFVENYFQPLSPLDLPVLLLENKVLDLDGRMALGAPAPKMPPAGAPWRIGWFGAIRCRKTWDILSRLAARMQGRVEIVIRGRVSPRQFPDFAAMVDKAPHVSFHGTYRNPEDLAAIYREVHFAWAIDFFEEGLNSEWLLPNRLYEASLHGAVPVALARTQTGRFLAARGLGLLLADADPQTLAAQLSALSVETYAALHDNLAAVERRQWITTRQDCEALVRQLAMLSPRRTTTADHALSHLLPSEG
ncbi:glycosyltransferase [Rhizobium sp. CSW-27]|uniref:glycosyltransferase n=1 Tax=Rhizobium sp. CSW-27 TaxID=2839985 RepID=UPI001C00F3EB|nr:glycosyl transferase family 1 [Rhizobium sp. CSW-27]